MKPLLWYRMVCTLLIAFDIAVSNNLTLSMSIGGPVTHLYESLTGNEWTKHGVSKYCSYSIYQQKEGETSWTPIVVNQTQWENSKENEDSSKFVWD